MTQTTTERDINVDRLVSLATGLRMSSNNELAGWCLEAAAEIMRLKEYEWKYKELCR